MVCFRLKRFDILKIPSEQPLGCSAFIFRELRLWKFVLRDSPMNFFKEGMVMQKTFFRARAAAGLISPGAHTEGQSS